MAWEQANLYRTQNYLDAGNNLLWTPKTSGMIGVAGYGTQRKTAQAQRGSQRQVCEARNGVGRNTLPETKYSNSKLQHEYKHSNDFGISGNWNSNNAKNYQNSIQNHINTAPDVYKSTYRGQDVYTYINQKTSIGVYTDLNGNYIGGWKFNDNQINFHLSNGTKIQL